MIRETLAARLRTLRMARGLTQEELGRVLGVSNVWYGAYERAKRRGVYLDEITKLGNALGVEVSYLLDLGRLTSAEQRLLRHFRRIPTESLRRLCLHAADRAYEASRERDADEQRGEAA